MHKQKPRLCENKDECCGCTACATICPKQAITFNYDKEGFLYPRVDFTKCVGCLKCEAVCSFKKDLKTPLLEDSKTKIYAAKSRNRDIVTNSSSGGMFTVFSDVFLERGDIVAACQYSYESASVMLSIITDKESRDKARGSKYIQVELKDSFHKLIALLRKHREKKALVFGTGCQIAGLDLVLKSMNLRDRVVLVDLICHGAASSNLWKNYISKIESEKGGSISYVTFKNKRKGWESPSGFVMIDGKEISIKSYSDWFYMGWSLRESCYKCPYTRIDRRSDITIGDYWGIQNVMPEFYDRMGISLVIVHTESGRKLFNNVSPAIDYQLSNRRECLQPRLISPHLRPNDRDLFWSDMQEKGMDYCIEKYVEYDDVSIKKKIKKCLKRLLKIQ